MGSQGLWDFVKFTGDLENEGVLGRNLTAGCSIDH